MLSQCHRPHTPDKNKRSRDRESQHHSTLAPAQYRPCALPSSFWHRWCKKVRKFERKLVVSLWVPRDPTLPTHLEPAAPSSPRRALRFLFRTDKQSTAPQITLWDPPHLPQCSMPNAWWEELNCFFELSSIDS